MSEIEIKQGNVEGWHIVEMMGHRKEIGFVTTEAYGAAVLFRVDTPGLPEREFILTRPEYADDGDSGLCRQWVPAGAKVKRAAVPPRSCLVAPGSLYAMNPCTEEAARHAIERNIERRLIVIEMPVQVALPAAPACCPSFPYCSCASDSAALNEDEDDEIDAADERDLRGVQF